MKFQTTLQIGKNGLTEGNLQALRSLFKTRDDVRISVLKNAGHTKENVKEIAEKIRAELGDHYTYRIVGFTIFLKKWRKAR
jgi:RNA-binding protein YhbY